MRYGLRHFKQENDIALEPVVITPECQDDAVQLSTNTAELEMLCDAFDSYSKAYSDVASIQQEYSEAKVENDFHADVLAGKMENELQSVLSTISGNLYSSRFASSTVFKSRKQESDFKRKGITGFQYKLEGLGDILGSIWEGIKKFFKAIWDFVAGIFKGIFGLFSSSSSSSSGGGGGGSSSSGSSGSSTASSLSEANEELRNISEEFKRSKSRIESTLAEMFEEFNEKLEKFEEKGKKAKSEDIAKAIEKLKNDYEEYIKKECKYHSFNLTILEEGRFFLFGFEHIYKDVIANFYKDVGLKKAYEMANKNDKVSDIIKEAKRNNLKGYEKKVVKFMDKYSIHSKEEFEENLKKYVRKLALEFLSKYKKLGTSSGTIADDILRNNAKSKFYASSITLLPSRMYDLESKLSVLANTISDDRKLLNLASNGKEIRNEILDLIPTGKMAFQDDIDKQISEKTGIKEFNIFLTRDIELKETAKVSHGEFKANAKFIVFDYTTKMFRNINDIEIVVRSNGVDYNKLTFRALDDILMNEISNCESDLRAHEQVADVMEKTYKEIEKHVNTILYSAEPDVLEERFNLKVNTKDINATMDAQRDAINARESIKGIIGILREILGNYGQVLPKAISDFSGVYKYYKRYQSRLNEYVKVSDQCFLALSKLIGRDHADATGIKELEKWFGEPGDETFEKKVDNNMENIMENFLLKYKR